MLRTHLLTDDGDDAECDESSWESPQACHANLPLLIGSSCTFSPFRVDGGDSNRWDSERETALSRSEAEVAYAEQTTELQAPRKSWFRLRQRNPTRHVRCEPLSGLASQALVAFFRTVAALDGVPAPVPLSRHCMRPRDRLGLTRLGKSEGTPIGQYRVLRR